MGKNVGGRFGSKIVSVAYTFSRAIDNYTGDNGDGTILRDSPVSYALNKQLACFFFQEEDDIRDYKVTGVQTCALPISGRADEQTGKPAFVFCGSRRQHPASDSEGKAAAVNLCCAGSSRLSITANFACFGLAPALRRSARGCRSWRRAGWSFRSPSRRSCWAWTASWGKSPLCCFR